MAETRIGTVIHYFGHLNVAAVDITDGELRIGDMIHIKGNSTDFQQTVESMQIEHGQVDVAKPGDSVGIQVIEKAREHDEVYKVT
jgi:putative protease